MTKEQALKQGFGQATAVHRHKLLVFSQAITVDKLGKHAFANSGFPGYQCQSIQLGNLFHLLQ